MNEYLKLYETMDAAVSDTTVVAPNVTLCKENMQVLMGGRELDIDEQMYIVYDGPDRLKYFENNYLTFTCLEDGNISLSNFGDNEPNIEYKLNNSDWEEWDYIGIPMVSGDTIVFRGNNENGFSLSGNVYSKFVITVGKFNASGSIMSLIDGIGKTLTIPSGGTFKNLFNGSSGLLTPPELPATGITAQCYAGMFAGCEKITTAPELPVETLQEFCYSYMFNGCKSLTSAPILPATTLATSCYYNMFGGCTTLTETPELPALTLKDGCYSHMFSGCTRLIEAKEMSFTSFDNGSNFCRHMFDSCASLITVQSELHPLIAGTNCYVYMFKSCTKLATAPGLPASTLADSCYYGMFDSCYKLTTAPVLPAETLVIKCYYDMFFYCSSLTYIKCLATDISAERCTGDLDITTTGWVYNVASEGQFVIPTSMRDDWNAKHTYYGKPTNFTYVDA